MSIALSPLAISSTIRRRGVWLPPADSGATSVALMLAEASTRKIYRPPMSRFDCQLGRSTAAISAATTSNCSSRQQIPPQSLPKAIDAQVFDRPLPKKRARHFERLAAELEKIERDQRRRHGAQQGPLPPRKHVDQFHAEGRGARGEGRGTRAGREQVFSAVTGPMSRSPKR